MKFTVAVPVIVAVLASGSAILASNPRRRVNRAVFAGCLQMVAWLVCWHMAATSIDGLLWLRWTCAVGAIAPVNFWIVQDSILAESSQRDRKSRWHGVLWVAVAFLFAVIPFSEAFIPANSTGSKRLYGWGYYAYIWGLVIVYALIFQNAYRSLRRLVGVAKLELQVWLGGGCALAAAVYFLMALSALTGDSTYRRLQPVAMLLFYVSTAFVITYSRIFDARQIVKALAEAGIMVGLLALSAAGVFSASSLILGDVGGLLLSVAACLWVSRWGGRYVRKWMHHYPEEDSVRAELMAISRRQSKLDILEHSFGAVLRGWWKTDDVLLVAGGHDGFRLDGVSREDEKVLLNELRESGWVTPERISRERHSPAKSVIRDFLALNRLSVLVLEQGPSMGV